MEIRPLLIPDALQRALDKKVQYLRYTRPQTIYYCVDADYRDVLVGVFGDGANGAYEWFIWDQDTAVLSTSDCGYGCTGVALCCGLVEAGAQRANGDHDLLLTWTRETNANLIAAGPDLLLAAKELVSRVNQGVEDWGLVSATEAVEAAIAKAEGRS